VIPRCGHAPQIEKSGLVNKLVQKFLLDKLKEKDIPLALDAERYLQVVDHSPRAGKGGWGRGGPSRTVVSIPSSPR
jgi:hypothetical protein